MSAPLRLDEFLARGDISCRIALRVLLAGADREGRISRDDLLKGMQREYRHLRESAGALPRRAADHGEISPLLAESPLGYFEEHTVGRLVDEGIVVLEPAAGRTDGDHGDGDGTWHAAQLTPAARQAWVDLRRQGDGDWLLRAGPPLGAATQEAAGSAAPAEPRAEPGEAPAVRTDRTDAEPALQRTMVEPEPAPVPPPSEAPAPEESLPIDERTSAEAPTVDAPATPAATPAAYEKPAVWREAESAALRGVADRPIHVDEREAPPPASRPLTGSTLKARGLVKAYRKRRVVNEVDIDVTEGEIVGLLGPNGAGKTTTFYMIVGLIAPDRGRVYLEDKDLTSIPMYRRARRGIGYLAQEPSIFRKLTVEENILAILQMRGIRRREQRERLDVLLDELGIKHLRHTKAYALSGGERRRLEITRALVGEPKFMLLDEPFAGVDPIAVHDIQQIVADLRRRGIGVLISDHNVEQTLDIVDRAYIMYDGRVRVSGTVSELVWNEEVAEIYLGPTLTARMRQRYTHPE